MPQIFISHDTADNAFAMRLADSLERFYSIWIDRQGLVGGIEWEREIEQALNDCAIFTVIVSTESNKSDWVARETIRAEQLGKYRIPILIDGELPLRLLNLQYIDFRADYDGGLLDLLNVLKPRIDPAERVRDETTTLIGAGIRARLGGDLLGANNIIGQALALDPSIAASIDAFWEVLRLKATTNLAADWMSQLTVIETSKRSTERTYEDDKPAFEWSLAINGPDAALAQVDRVVYHLHPTFSPSEETIRSRESRFSFTWIGWGTFMVGVEVFFVDGTSATIDHSISFPN